MQYESDYLAHHGIKGQKWGVKNGPPYPLYRQKGKGHSKSKAQYGKFIYNEDHEAAYNLVKPVGEKKTLGNVALKAAKAKLNAQGKIYPYVIPEVSSLVGNVAGAGAFVKGLHDLKKEKKNANKTEYGESNDVFKKQTTKFSDKKDLEVINKENADGPRNNCTFCTAAFDLRKRGYDVVAGKLDPARGGMYDDEILKMYPGSKMREIKGSGRELTTSVGKELSSQPNTRGNLLIKWTETAGHSIAYQVDNKGHTLLYDAQTAKVYTLDGVLNYCVGASYIRLDNRKPDLNYMRKRGIVHDRE